MKKKIVPKWLHRLRVLLLALILALMPLTIAVPADASVLSGGEYTVYSFGGQTVYFPGVHYADAVVVGVEGSLYHIYAFYADSALNYSSSNSISGKVSASSTLYSALLTFDYLPEVIDFRNAEFYVDDVFYSELVYNPVMTYGSQYTTGFNFTIGSDYFTSVGVLDTFSGVGSWLSGALTSISAMFWTADSGMTVLGYLAVASLALAVILLIFYLIAGWLKFH